MSVGAETSAFGVVTARVPLGGRDRGISGGLGSILPRRNCLPSYFFAPGGGHSRCTQVREYAGTERLVDSVGIAGRLADSIDVASSQFIEAPGTLFLV